MATLKTALLSITFRSLEAERIISLAAQAGLDGIEWGGDVHVPPTNLAHAQRIGDATRAAGLLPLAYGSYYRAGAPDRPSRAQVVDTACALGTTDIRVWAGNQNPDRYDSEGRYAVIDDLQQLATLAADAGCKIHLEYHANTLTNSCHDAMDLMAVLNHPNIGLYWQPDFRLTRKQQLADLATALPHITHLHTFFWVLTGGQFYRQPLAHGKMLWEAVLASLKAHPMQGRYLGLEFVKDDAEAQFLQDAQTLTTWLGHP
jgi:sugar phosphate isomerase/epimerase